jgi:hypothetical protein
VTPTGSWYCWLRLRSDRKWRRWSAHPRELLADLAGAVARAVIRARCDVVSLPRGVSPRAASRKLRTERVVCGGTVTPGRRTQEGD